MAPAVYLISAWLLLVDAFAIFCILGRHDYRRAGKNLQSGWRCPLSECAKMATPLLQTKSYVPRVRPELAPQPGFVEGLNAGLHRNPLLHCVQPVAGSASVRRTAPHIFEGMCPFRNISPPSE